MPRPAQPTAPKIEWISVQECATRFDVRDKTVRRWIAAGLVDARRFGPKLIRIDAASVERMSSTI